MKTREEEALRFKAKKREQTNKKKLKMGHRNSLQYL